MNLNEAKTLKVSGLAQVFVNANTMHLMLLDEAGNRITLEIPPEVDREIIHIMADALRARSQPDFDAKSGHLLAHAHVLQNHFQSALEPLQLQEKLVLRAQSEGMTAISYRLSETSVRRWIDEMEQVLALEGKSPRKSS